MTPVKKTAQEYYKEAMSAVNGCSMEAAKLLQAQQARIWSAIQKREIWGHQAEIMMREAEKMDTAETRLTKKQ